MSYEHIVWLQQAEPNSEKPHSVRLFCGLFAMYPSSDVHYPNEKIRKAWSSINKASA